LLAEDDPLGGAAVVVAPVPEGGVVVADAPLFELPQAARTAPRRRRPTRTVAPRGARPRKDDDVVMGELLLSMVLVRTQLARV
jgi:hypothetical protein